MRDIVATIQPEQDVIVRADLSRSVCVQGAPGTGKTAVGLHRAAYLLYVHRERLRRAGVLVLGPNRAFLRYIAAVLPALGETVYAGRGLGCFVNGTPAHVSARDRLAGAYVSSCGYDYWADDVVAGIIASVRATVTSEQR